MRRALVITAAVIFVLATAAAVYFFFFANKGGTLTVGGNPFAGTGAPSGGAPSIVLGQGAGTLVAPHLVKITDGPVAAGFIALATSSPTGGAATSTAPDVEVRYVDRASGNIYAFMVHARVLSRLSNKTLPGVQEASWLANGSMAYLRYLTKDSTSNEHLSTYALSADGTNGFALESDLDEAITASSSVFTLLSGTTGSVGTLAKGDGTNARTLFTSLLSSLVVLPSNTGFFAYTRASSGLPGHAFSIASKNGAFTYLLGPLRGLTILPAPSGKMVLYSYVDNGAPRLAVIDTTSHAATALPLGTFTEKCVWSKDGLALYCAVPTTISGTLPDDWYQGTVTFSDRLWRIDMTARTATLIVDPNQLAKTPLDITSLALDAANDTLTFMDKTSGSLWVYDL